MTNFNEATRHRKPGITAGRRSAEVTRPAQLRRKLGLKKGDLVAITETEEGVLVTPQGVVTMKALDRIGEALKKRGLSPEELIGTGREIRGQTIEERYGAPSDRKD